MFGRQNFGTMFQPSPFGQYPFGVGGGFSGLSGMAPQFGGSSHIPQLSALQLAACATPGMGHFGVPIASHLNNPSISAQFGAINPLFQSPLMQHPQIAQHLAAANPMILPYLLAQQGGGGGAFSPQFSQGLSNPWLQSSGIESLYPGLSPFGGQFGGSNIPYGSHPFQGAIGSQSFPQMGALTQPQSFGSISLYQSPYQSQEQLFNPWLPQHLQSLALQRLPIRPLFGQQQYDPYQAGISGLPWLSGWPGGAFNL